MGSLSWRCLGRCTSNFNMGRKLALHNSGQAKTQRLARQLIATLSGTDCRSSMIAAVARPIVP